ncbi:MAG: GGDEF domain-containing protein [Candidatus Accumulibacter sp.]|jgi:diguanylate cyclase|nr:GGDEF domain-containing protein [Accumulibacter sp.]
MSATENPTEIARQTLKTLLSRRMPPTPTNYRAIYNELAGIKEPLAENFPERTLKILLDALPDETPAQQRLRRDIEQAIKNRDENAYEETLTGFIATCGAESQMRWGELIGELIRQWDSRLSGPTPARKREALEHVLASASRNTELLYTRLQHLVESWSLTPAGMDGPAKISGEPPDTTPSLKNHLSATENLTPDFRDMLAYALEVMLIAQISNEPDLAEEAREIARFVRSADTFKAAQDILASIKRLAFRLEFLAEDRNELRESLLRLLRAMIENANDLVLDDKWISGQIEMVRDIMSRPPNIRAVNDAEQRLREVLSRQNQLRQKLLEARKSLKQMLSGFIDHLAEFAETTSDYHDRIEALSKKIGQTNDISQIESILADVMRETRNIQFDAQRSRDDLRLAKQKAEEAQKHVDELQAELEKTSELIRHDHLTGAMNRKGMNEILTMEIARSKRRESPICIAFLDIDNFKKLNDRIGHMAGDAALIHFASIVRKTIRPQDTLARFGGEEFIILLPDTKIAEAEKALIRLQRELTRQFFMNNNEKVLITFSAGATEIRDDDDGESALKRADEAMYRAKQSGKNRVILA